MVSPDFFIYAIWMKKHAKNKRDREFYAKIVSDELEQFEIDKYLDDLRRGHTILRYYKYGVLHPFEEEHFKPHFPSLKSVPNRKVNKYVIQLKYKEVIL